MKHFTSCIALVAFLGCASAAHVSLHSGRSDYLGAKKEHSQLTPDGLSGVLAALLSVEPSSESIAAASAQVLCTLYMILHGLCGMVANCLSLKVDEHSI